MLYSGLGACAKLLELTYLRAPRMSRRSEALALATSALLGDALAALFANVQCLGELMVRAVSAVTSNIPCVGMPAHVAACSHPLVAGAALARLHCGWHANAILCFLCQILMLIPAPCVCVMQLIVFLTANMITVCGVSGMPARFLSLSVAGHRQMLPYRKAIVLKTNC